MKNVFLYLTVLFLIMASVCMAQIEFENITPQELKETIDSGKDCVLIDVHVPEQKHIQGTDEFIPYNVLRENKDKMPADKNKKIVVYCRTDAMSTKAAGELADMGYTNVYNLEGGVVGWQKIGFEVDGPDRIIYLNAKRFSFSPDTLKVKQGEKIRIIAKSSDVQHGFAIDKLKINSKIDPGKENIIEFTADQKGKFVFRCSVYCGPGHGNMVGNLIVE